MTTVTKKYKINGPNNIIRLTNGEKIIYLLGEFHYNIEDEKECEFDSKHETLDVDKFLIKFFGKEKNKNFDFFLEMQKFDIETYASYKKQKKQYLEQLRKMVAKESKIDNNKIIISENYSNIRFHTFDFRWEISNEFKYLFDLMDGRMNFIFPYDKNSLIQIYSTLPEIINNYNKFLEFLKFGESVYINKIKNKYNNKDIKKKINNIYQKSVIGFINNNIKLANKILDYMEKNTNNLLSIYISKIEKIEIQKFILINLSDLMAKLISPFVILIDLYLLRRILDKKYTTNNIVYTGQYHLVDIAVLLVKHFDFKITNTFYLDEKIKDINKFIKKMDTDDYSYIEKLSVYLTNITEQYGIEQCADLFDFPDNFS